VSSCWWPTENPGYSADMEFMSVPHPDDVSRLFQQFPIALIDQKQYFSYAECVAYRSPHSSLVVVVDFPVHNIENDDTDGKSEGYSWGWRKGFVLPC